MIDLRKDKIIDPTPHRSQSKGTFALKDLVMKHYGQLEAIVNDLAEKCIGGEEASIVFNMGKVTIKLK